MALTDPQSLTISGTTYTLARHTPASGRTEYVNSDGTVKLVILQSTGKRKRSSVRVEITKVAADPLTAVNSYVSQAVYIMFDRPVVGFSDAEIVSVMTGLNTALAASSNALATRVVQGES